MNRGESLCLGVHWVVLTGIFFLCENKLKISFLNETIYIGEMI